MSVLPFHASRLICAAEGKILSRQAGEAAPAGRTVLQRLIQGAGLQPGDRHALTEDRVEAGHRVAQDQ